MYLILATLLNLFDIYVRITEIYTMCNPTLYTTLFEYIGTSEYNLFAISYPVQYWAVFLVVTAFSLLTASSMLTASLLAASLVLTAF
jgi:hypothetical protein